MIKTIEFINKQGEKIKGIVKEKNTGGPLLIVGHGLNSSKEHPATDGVTNRLYTMGHSTFSFDFSQSAQEFSLKEQVSDIFDVIRHFHNYKSIILLAPSLGALSMVIAATQSENVKGLITINGFFGTAQLGRSIIKTYLLFRLFVFFNKQYKNQWDYFKKSYKPEKMNGKALVMHAKHDEVVSFAQSKTFFNRVAGEKTLYVLEQADHNLTQESYKQEVAEVIDQWLKKTDK